MRFNHFQQVRARERLTEMGVLHDSPQAACYLDDQMSGFEVYGNTFTDCQTAVIVGGGRDNQIHGNFFESCDFDILFGDRGLTWQAKIAWQNCSLQMGQGRCLRTALEQLQYQLAPYATRYPEIVNIFHNYPGTPVGNTFMDNVYCHAKSRSGGQFIGQGAWQGATLSQTEVEAWMSRMSNNVENCQTPHDIHRATGLKSVGSQRPPPTASRTTVKTDDPPVHIGQATQLFIDDAIIAATANLTRTMHSPAMTRVVVTADAAWETKFNLTVGVLGASLVSDGGKLKMWYPLRNSSLGCRKEGVSPSSNSQPNCSSNNSQPNVDAAPIFLAYAESTNGGQTFTKPILNMYSFEGSKANNIIGAYVGMSVFIDPIEPAGSPRRFRGIDGNQALSSPDGLVWTRVGSEGVYNLTQTIPGNKGHGSYDTQSCLFFDVGCSCWSLFTRWNDGDGGNSRMVRRARSSRLNIHGKSNNSVGHWVNQSVVMGADSLDTSTHAGTQPVDYYGSTTWFSTAAQMYFMVAVRFWHWGPDRNGPRTKDLALAASRDGANFTFVKRTPWLRPGLEGSAGSRSMWLVGPGPIRQGDEELYFVTRSNVDEGMVSRRLPLYSTIEPPL